MAKFKVEQVVQCEVRVWYVVNAPTHQEALAIVSKNDCPTSGSIAGTDYEIISDGKIKYTLINGFQSGE
jgi:hypothetical protein